MRLNGGRRGGRARRGVGSHVSFGARVAGWLGESEDERGVGGRV